MKFPVETIRAFGEAVSVKAGMSPENAKIFIDNMINADLRNVRSHGITKFRGYLSRVEHGVSDIKAEPTIVKTAPATLAVDGNNGMGTTVAWKAMEACIETARENGVAFATIKNASQHGFGGYYVMHAAEQGMIAFEACNSPKLVAPFGGAKPLLGTNPMSIAVPAGKRPMLVCDMATSVVAKGKIALAMKEGRPIPDTWALDSEGRKTTDPVAANTGVLLPFGGPKGYALALIIDVLCHSLAGANDSQHIPRVFENLEEPSNIGYVMCVIDIRKFLPLEDFEQSVDALFESIKACPPAEGSNGVLIPGEIEYEATQKNREEGIELSEPVLKEFHELSEKYGVDFPF